MILYDRSNVKKLTPTSLRMQLREKYIIDNYRLINHGWSNLYWQIMFTSYMAIQFSMYYVLFFFSHPSLVLDLLSCCRYGQRCLLKSYMTRLTICVLHYFQFSSSMKTQTRGFSLVLTKRIYCILSWFLIDIIDYSNEETTFLHIVPVVLVTL